MSRVRDASHTLLFDACRPWKVCRMPRVTRDPVSPRDPSAPSTATPFQWPSQITLSVVVPVFNEARTIEAVMQRLLTVPIPMEIVIVDDGSVDGTRALLEDRLAAWRDLARQGTRLELVLHDGNQGKGAALRTGFQKVTGMIVTIQDADLEYDPHEFLHLAQPILEDRADVVYGSRYARGSNSDSPAWHRWGNRTITQLSNFATGCDWTDVETCYKMMRTELVRKIAPTLRERGFGIELELTAKLARLPRVRLHERPIAYRRRGYAEGKKIGLKDGFHAMACIVRYRWRD